MNAKSIMAKEAHMNKSLLPLTKFGIVMSAVVPFVFALAQLFAPGLLDSFLWAPPFEPIPAVALRYIAASYLALTLGGAYTLQKNSWSTARGFLAVAGSYVAIAVIVSLVSAATPPGVPPILWLYVFLGIIYVALLPVAWRRESARASAA